MNQRFHRKRTNPPLWEDPQRVEEHLDSTKQNRERKTKTQPSPFSSFYSILTFRRTSSTNPREKQCLSLSRFMTDRCSVTVVPEKQIPSANLLWYSRSIFLERPSCISPIWSHKSHGLCTSVLFSFR